VNSAFFLSNTNTQNNFLDNENKNKNNNKPKAEEQNGEKVNKTLINFSSNDRKISLENSINLQFLESANSNSTLTEPNNNDNNENKEKEENSGGEIRSSINDMSKIAAILDKLNLINNSYLKKLLGCFEDVKPVFDDLINAYTYKNQNQTESLMNVLTQLVSKMYDDGEKITSDCKVLFMLAGIAGVF